MPTCIVDLQKNNANRQINCFVVHVLDLGFLDFYGK